MMPACKVKNRESEEPCVSLTSLFQGLLHHLAFVDIWQICVVCIAEGMDGWMIGEVVLKGSLQLFGLELNTDKGE